MTGSVKVGTDCESVSIGFEEKIAAFWDYPAGMSGGVAFQKVPQKQVNVNLPLSVQVRILTIFLKIKMDYFLFCFCTRVTKSVSRIFIN